MLIWYDIWCIRYHISIISATLPSSGRVADMISDTTFWYDENFKFSSYHENLKFKFIFFKIQNWLQNIKFPEIFKISNFRLGESKADPMQKSGIISGGLLIWYLILTRLSDTRIWWSGWYLIWYWYWYIRYHISIISEGRSGGASDIWILIRCWSSENSCGN